MEKTNETLQLIFNRVSLRKYDKKQISDEHLNLILDATMRAPTAGNNMLYSIIIIKDYQTKEKLAISCDNQPFIKDASCIMVFLADVKRLYDYFKLCNVEKFCAENDLTYNHPNLQMLYLALNDALIAAQTAVIAAESLGIGSCYIGDIAERFEYHKQLLNLPENVFIATMFCFGYYPQGYQKKLRPRFDKKYIVHNEKYNIIDSVQLENVYKLYANEFKLRLNDNSPQVAEVEANRKLKYENYGHYLYAKKFGSEFALELERSIKEMLKNWG